VDAVPPQPDFGGDRHLKTAIREEVIMLNSPEHEHPPEGRRTGRLDVVSTLLQATQTILLLLRLLGDC
jgi:hypothetical protein